MNEMAWYIPLLIFGARICDVSIGTTRMILTVAGHRVISSVLGFFEVIIWVLAVGGAIRYLDHVTALLGYGGGFATGVLVGMTIENRIALGYRLVRAINRDPAIDLSAALREQGHRVTRVEGTGQSGPVEIAFMVVRRRGLPEVKRQIAEIAPEAFMTIEWTDRPTSGPLGPTQHGIFSRFRLGK